MIETRKQPLAPRQDLPPRRDPNAPYPLVVTYHGYNGHDGKPLRVPASFASAEERAEIVEGMRRCYDLKPYRLTETARDAFGVCELRVETTYATTPGARAEGAGGEGAHNETQRDAT